MLLATIYFHCETCDYDFDLSTMDFMLPEEDSDTVFCASIAEYYVCPKCKKIDRRGPGSEVKDEYKCKDCSTVLLEIDVEPPEFAGEKYLGDYSVTCPICGKEMKLKKISITD